MTCHELRYDHMYCVLLILNLSALAISLRDRLGAAAAKAAAQQPWCTLETLPTMTSEAEMAATSVRNCTNGSPMLGTKNAAHKCREKSKTQRQRDLPNLILA